MLKRCLLKSIVRKSRLNQGHLQECYNMKRLKAKAMRVNPLQDSRQMMHNIAAFLQEFDLEASILKHPNYLGSCANYSS